MTRLFWVAIAAAVSIAWDHAGATEPVAAEPPAALTGPARVAGPAAVPAAETSEVGSKVAVAADGPPITEERPAREIVPAIVAETKLAAPVPAVSASSRLSHRHRKRAVVVVGTSAGDRAVDLSQGWAENRRAVATTGDEGRVIFRFGEAIPKIICAPIHICDIELEPGEVVNDRPQIGDSVRWKVSPSVSGEGPKKTVHVVVKPTESGLDTDLLIPTNRRAYRLRLVSRDTAFVYAVAFSYPDSEAEQWNTVVADAKAKADPPGLVSDLPDVAVNQLDFNYEISVDQGEGRLRPVRVFSDGRRTFVQMPDGMRAAEAPALVLVGNDGSDELVNYRLREGYFVIDRLVEQAALIDGVGDDQERVLITHTSCTRRTLLGFCER